MNVDQNDSTLFLDHTTTVVLVVVLAAAAIIACVVQLSVFSVFFRGLFSSRTAAETPSTSLLTQDVVNRNRNAAADVSAQAS